MDALLLLFLIVLNGVFAMAELAMIAARETRLQPAADNGDAGADAVLALKRRPTRLLSTVQIGITSIGILNGIVGESALAGPLANTLQSAGVAAQVAATSATALVVVIITFASIVIGELLPKRIAQSAPERLARVLARPMTLLARLAAPFVWLLSASTNGLMRLLRVPEGDDTAITDEEIQALLGAGIRAGLIEPAEFEMVRRVFGLDDRRVGSYMTPRRQMIVLDARAPLRDNLRRALEASCSRYPVADGPGGEILGFIHTRELLRAALEPANGHWPPTLASPLVVPETSSGRVLLERLQEHGSSAALVVDEYGDLQGMVTTTDLFAAIAGDPETDSRTRAVTRLAADSFRVDGLLPAHELLDLLGLSALPGPSPIPYDSTGGMMQQLLGHLPRNGDVASWQGWRFEIALATPRRVRRVLITREPDGGIDAAPAAGRNGVGGLDDAR
ncbi:MAG: hemolysin family protein [Burkholderiaceae bacterium]